MQEEFWTVHSGLEREGPGEPADIAWIAETLGLAPDAKVCDAACGPGADVPAWLDAVPQGHVTAVEQHRPFVDELHGRIGNHDRLTAYAGDYMKLKGPFDLIYCAGAVYFQGIERVLEAWRPCLAPGGAVAFSEPCFFTDTPTEAARTFWSGYPTMTVPEIGKAVSDAGYETIASRPVSDAAWERYYRSVEARIAELRADPATASNEELLLQLDVNQLEADTWRRHRAETGYLLSIVRPV